MKSISYIPLILALFLVAALIDARPDPPAVNPNTVYVKDSAPREFAIGFEQRSDCDPTLTSPHLPVCPGNLTETVKPGRPSDDMAALAYAADPSPPTL